MNFHDSLTAAIAQVFPEAVAYDDSLKRAGATELNLYLVVFFEAEGPVEVWLPACDTLVDLIRPIWLKTPPVEAMHRQRVDTLKRITIALTKVGDE